MRVARFIIASALLLLISVFMFGCGSPMLTGAKTALQENPPDWERAEKLTRQALTDTPNDWEAHMYMAMIHNHFGRYEEAGPEFDKANQLAADTPEAVKTINRKRFENAVSLMKDKRYEAAANEIENIDGDVAENSSELYNIGVLYLQLAKTAKEKEDEQAIEKYTGKAIESFAKTTVAADKEVVLAESSKKLSEKDIKQVKADAATSYSGLALAYSSAGEYEKAIEAYEKAVELDPENEKLQESLKNARFEMGVTYIEENKYDEAVAYYQSILEKSPEAADTYYFIGKTYMKKADYLKDNAQPEAAKAAEQEAVRYFKKYLEINPEDAETLDDLYKIYMRSDNFAQAKEMATKMTALYPDKATEFVFIYLGQACHQSEDYEGALAAFNKYIEVKPDDVMGYHLKAAALMKMVQREEAAGNADKAAEYQKQAQEIYEQANKLQGQGE